VRRGRAALRRLLAPGPLLALLLLPAAAADLLAPAPPDRQEDVAGARFLPPLTRVHLMRGPGTRLRIVTDLQRTTDGWTARRAGRIETIPDRELPARPEPRLYLLGTDGLGRDVFSRILFGLRHSAAVAALAVGLALGVALAFGAAAVFGGPFCDALVMRGTDVVMAIPRLVLFLVCATLLAPSTLLLVLVLGATTWTGLARLVRVELLALAGGDLEAAARATGSRPARILIRHLLPQMVPTLATAAALRFADTILLEAAVSLLGLGATPPAVSLGSVMASGRESLGTGWWLVLFPGLLLAALVLLLRSAATSLERRLDPPSLV
jgi:peptide/nickel transport system permease protein